MNQDYSFPKLVVFSKHGRKRLYERYFKASDPAHRAAHELQIVLRVINPRAQYQVHVEE